MFNVFHPMDGKCLPRTNKVYLTRYGEEREGPGWRDKRWWVLTVVDPFDVWGLVMGREGKERFWEEDEREWEREKERQVAGRGEVRYNEGKGKGGAVNHEEAV